ncbi:hypothetical protein KS18_25185, partial [Photorhabdus luminescens]
GNAQLLGLFSVSGVIGQHRAVDRGAGIVGKHQGVFIAGELKAVKNPLFGGEPLQEFKIGFAVLDAELPFRVRIAQTERHIADAVLFEQGGDDGFDILLLKNPGILAQGGAPHIGPDGHVIAGLIRIVR